LAAAPPRRSADAPARTRAAAAPQAVGAGPAAAETVVPAPVAAVGTGALHLAVSPWGEVEVDGTAAGTTPPLTRLTLPVGMHTVTVRNADFPPHTVQVEVSADRPVTLRHRFGL
jgi:serine/threonine-protein kinase